jgi:hypothetical protein
MAVVVAALVAAKIAACRKWIYGMLV